MLSPAENQRYARHMALPNFGLSSQLKLKAARVLVIGAGGLGSPVLQYLTAAGVGTIGIVDPDRVSSSNLQRQVLYGEKDLGQLKVDAAEERLHDLNPHISIQKFPVSFTAENALSILSHFELVVDGTDNFPTRYLVNDACVLSGIPYVYGSIFRFEGQLSVFNAREKNGNRGPNYRDLFPSPPPPNQVPNCAEGGVLGVLPGIIGSLQANEAIKIITGIGEVLSGKLLLFDAASLAQRTMGFSARADTTIEQLIDYELFCGLPNRESIPAMDAAAFLAMQKKKTPFLLLDVRTPQEYEGDHLGGLLIPLDQLEVQWTSIPNDKPILVHCQSGARSTQAVEFLLKKGYREVFNLEGGIQAVRRLS